MVQFFIACEPATVGLHHKGRNGNRTFDKPELVAAKKMYEYLLVPHRPARPLKGPVYLALYFYFPFPKSASKKMRERGGFKITKPDGSNAAKVLEDCLQRSGFFKNDSQVAFLVVKKFYSNETGVHIICENAAG